jgi:DNA polymerase-3 subunit epsilon
MRDSFLSTLMGWLGVARGREHATPERWIMVDVETTGLNPASDRLLAIAAVALRQDPITKNLRVVLSDSFEVVLRQTQPSAKDNILIHRIGAEAQTQGEAPEAALENFRAWVGSSPLLAYHAAFDAGMIRRAYRSYNLEALKVQWLDVAPLARMFGGNVHAKALDDWLKHFNIECAVRHQAASDAFATAELLLRLWPAISREAQSWRGLTRLARGAAWIPS